MSSRSAAPGGAALGITVMPEYAQYEGVDQVLYHIADVAGAVSLTTSPYVMSPTADGGGSREPPADAGQGGARLLDRPLWGRRELYVDTAPSFVPTPSRYAGRYRPAEPTALTERYGAVVGEFIGAAKRRGMSVYLQVMAAAPPGYRVQFGAPDPDDQMRLPDGAALPGRVDGNITLASVELRHYMRGLLADLSQHYPDVDGFKFDWPEIPPYEFRSLFFDFNPQVEAVARAAGIDFIALRSAALALYRNPLRELAALGDEFADPQRPPTPQRLLARSAPLRELLRLRRALVGDYLRFLRAAVDEVGGKKIFLQSFPPPWNLLSGFDYGDAAGCAELIGAKIYTMHWPMMERNYVDALRSMTGLEPPRLADAVRTLLQTTRRPVDAPERLRYPAPDEPHPADDDCIEDKLRRAGRDAGATEFWGLSHGYGPLDDVLRRFDAALRGANGRVYINRYAYLSDDKLAAIGERLRRYKSS